MGYMFITSISGIRLVSVILILQAKRNRHIAALSDAEGKKLSDAVGALSPKMSEKAFRDSIGKIRNQRQPGIPAVRSAGSRHPDDFSQFAIRRDSSQPLVVRGRTESLALIAVYIALMFTVVKKSLSLIHVIPDEISNTR